MSFNGNIILAFSPPNVLLGLKPPLEFCYGSSLLIFDKKGGLLSMLG